MSLGQQLFSSRKPESKAPKSKQTDSDELKAFVKVDPTARYTFDSERDVPESEICREGKESRKCIKLHMYSTQMFQAMQDQGFYCALPMDPGRTHIECIPMPKT